MLDHSHDYSSLYIVMDTKSTISGRVKKQKATIRTRKPGEAKRQTTIKRRKRYYWVTACFLKATTIPGSIAMTTTFYDKCDIMEGTIDVDKQPSYEEVVATYRNDPADIPLCCYALELAAADVPRYRAAFDKMGKARIPGERFWLVKQ